MPRPLTPKQLDTLAQIRFAGMHYVPDVTAWLAGEGQPARLHLSAVKRLIADGYVEPDDDDVWYTTTTGDAALRAQPDYLAPAGRADALRQGQAIVTQLRQAKLKKQHTGDEEERVSAALTRALRTAGSVQTDVGQLTVLPEEWRRIARAAAKSLGRPIQTLIAGDQLVAILTDWPASADEQRIHDARLRAAVDRIAD